mmetsp:Transcript_22128/g.74422  ORF Transcript_22128/g.74422 Transcript_22128/m.74422 type:complete len:216 (+) Transcript_22128:836-1483(+)
MNTHIYIGGATLPPRNYCSARCLRWRRLGGARASSVAVALLPSLRSRAGHNLVGGLARSRQGLTTVAAADPAPTRNGSEGLSHAFPRARRRLQHYAPARSSSRMPVTVPEPAPQPVALKWSSSTVVYRCPSSMRACTALRTASSWCWPARRVTMSRTCMPMSSSSASLHILTISSFSCAAAGSACATGAGMPPRGAAGSLAAPSAWKPLECAMCT